MSILFPDTLAGQVAYSDIKGQLRAAHTIESVKPPVPDRLNSWKEIANFFDRDVRTVRRWEETRGLPVHRMPGGGRSGVYAYVLELERWMREVPAEIPIAAAAAEPERDEFLADVQPSNEVAGRPGRDTPQGDSREVREVPSPAATETTAVASPVSPGITRRRVAIGIVLLLAALFCVFAVRQSIHASPGVEPREKSGKPSVNAEAQELYLKGMFLWNQRTEQSLTDAVDLFTQAIVHDPHFAAAYAGLADSYLLLRQYGKMPDNEAFPRALAASRQALALDDSSPQAHRSYAFVLNYWMWNFPEAENEFRRSLELNKDDAQTHSWYATSLYSQGRYPDAMHEIDEARQLQPDSITILANRGLLLASTDPPAAIDYLKELERINPSFSNVPLYLAGVELSQGNDREFLEESRRAAELHKSDDEVRLTDEAAKQWKLHGRTGMLQLLGSDYGKRVDEGAPGAMVAASLYGRLRDQAATLHYLKLASERRESAFLSISHDGAFQFLQGNPEFEDLVRKRNTPLALPDALRTAARISGKVTPAPQGP